MTQDEFNSLQIGDTIAGGISDLWIVTALHEGRAILTQTVSLCADDALAEGFRLSNKQADKENHILENISYLSAQLSAQIEEWEKGNGVAAMATPEVSDKGLTMTSFLMDRFPEVSGNHITGCKVFIHEADKEYGHSPTYIGLYTDPRDGNTRCGRCHEIWALPPWSPGGEK